MDSADKFILKFSQFVMSCQRFDVNFFRGIGSTFVPAYYSYGALHMITHNRISRSGRVKSDDHRRNS